MFEPAGFRSDAQYLTDQYDNRGAVPDHPTIFKGWAERSALARDELAPIVNLAYGDHPRQLLDLFIPAGVDTPPLCVFFHGGYWQAMSKDHFSFVVQGLVRSGVSVAVVNYRLCPEVRVGEIVDDARLVCLWLMDNGGSLGVDISRIHLLGHSAGGHLAAMVASTDWPELMAEQSLNPAERLKLTLSISGLFRLDRLLPTPVNDALGLDEAEAAGLSPALMRPIATGTALLAVGEFESDEYHRQGLWLQDSWGSKGVEIDRLTLVGRNHFTILDDLSEPGGPLLERTLSLIRGC